MFLKIHKTYRDVVAICDEELIGKRFEEGKFQLDIKENFFRGEQFSKEKIIPIMQDLAREDATFNIVGENSVKSAIRAGIISEKGIKRVSNIPFALVLV